MSTLEHAALTSATSAIGTALIAVVAFAVTGLPDGVDPTSALLLVSAVSTVLLLAITVLLGAAVAVRRALPAR